MLRLGLPLLALAVIQAAAADWSPPPGFPAPILPEDALMAGARIELGRRLFYEPDLSSNGRVSCGSCHVQARGFAAAQHPPQGATNEALPRDAPSLVNLAWRSRFGWADNSVDSLEAQMLRPLYNDHPVEMGFGLDTNVVLARLDRPAYVAAFRDAFPGEDNPATPDNIIKAIAAFERTLVSANSVYDNWVFRDVRPAEPVVRGFQLFFSDRVQCGGCHSGINFNGDFVTKPGSANLDLWHNTGVSTTDSGLFEVTGVAADKGKFKTPTLRNIACTAPYMHNGRFTSLDEVIDHYAKGPAPELKEFNISAEDRADLVTFLHALTDLHFLEAREFSDPASDLIGVAPAIRGTPHSCDRR